MSGATNRNLIHIQGALPMENKTNKIFLVIIIVLFAIIGFQELQIQELSYLESRLLYSRYY